MKRILCLFLVLAVTVCSVVSATAVPVYASTGSYDYTDYLTWDDGNCTWLEADTTDSWDNLSPYAQACVVVDAWAHFGDWTSDQLKAFTSDSTAWYDINNNIASSALLKAGVSLLNAPGSALSAVVNAFTKTEDGTWDISKGKFSVDDDGNVTYDADGLNAVRDYALSCVGYTVYPSLTDDVDYWALRLGVTDAYYSNFANFYDSNVSRNIIVDSKGTKLYSFYYNLGSTSDSGNYYYSRDNIYLDTLNLDDVAFYYKQGSTWSSSGSDGSYSGYSYYLMYAYYDSGLVTDSQYVYVYDSGKQYYRYNARYGGVGYGLITYASDDATLSVGDRRDEILGCIGKTLIVYDSYDTWLAYYNMLHGYTSYSAPIYYVSGDSVTNNYTTTVDDIVNNDYSTQVTNNYNTVTNNITNNITNQSSLTSEEYQQIIDDVLVAVQGDSGGTSSGDGTVDTDSDESLKYWLIQIYNQVVSFKNSVVSKLSGFADDVSEGFNDLHNMIVNLNSTVITAITDFMEVYNTTASQGNSYLADIKNNTLSGTGEINGTSLGDIKTVLDDILSALGGGSSGDDSSATEEETDDDSTQIGLLRKIKNLLGLIVIGQGVDTATDLLEYGTDELTDWKDNLVSAVTEVGDAMQEVFPFCIPWALIAVISAFVADAEAPEFDLPIKIERLGIDYTIHIDLSDFENVSVICRTLLGVIFAVGLMRWTVSLTNGGGDSE